jgi:hypothetical protein
MTRDPIAGGLPVESSGYAGCKAELAEVRARMSPGWMPSHTRQAVRSLSSVDSGSAGRGAP